MRGKYSRSPFPHNRLESRRVFNSERHTTVCPNVVHFSRFLRGGDVKASFVEHERHGHYMGITVSGGCEIHQLVLRQKILVLHRFHFPMKFFASLATSNHLVLDVGAMTAHSFIT